jgi:hypothetical protein
MKTNENTKKKKKEMAIAEQNHYLTKDWTSKCIAYLTRLIINLIVKWPVHCNSRFYTVIGSTLSSIT